LNAAEQAIIRLALPQEKIDRDDIVDILTEEFSEKAVQDAFTALKQEDRLFRKGNNSEYVMIRRDLF
jgi:hypothetical protein